MERASEREDGRLAETSRIWPFQDMIKLGADLDLGRIRSSCVAIQILRYTKM